MHKKWQAELVGCGVGLMVGAALGILPGLGDALRPTQYAQMFGRAAVIGMFLPVAFIGALVGGFVGILVGGGCWQARQPPRQPPRPAPDEQDWPPVPREP